MGHTTIYWILMELLFFNEYCKEKSPFFTKQLAIDLLTLKTLLLPFGIQRSTTALKSWFVLCASFHVLKG